MKNYDLSSLYKIYVKWWLLDKMSFTYISKYEKLVKLG